MIRLGVNIAVIDGETLLLTLREDFEVWCLPGGAVDEGESLADAARREAREETGLEVELTQLVGMYSHIGWRDLHIALFTAHVSGGLLTPQPGEVLDARFFPFNALPEDFTVGTKHRLQDAISGAVGVVKTEFVPVPLGIPENRAQIYALRDQSGLSRREYYLHNIPQLKPEQIKIEIAGSNNHD